VFTPTTLGRTNSRRATGYLLRPPPGHSFHQGERRLSGRARL